MSTYTIHHGSNIDILKSIDTQVDAVVTDPPYGLSFMGKKWDYDVPSVEFWKAVYSVLKPGGHVLSFGGSRTYHRMACNLEDAGFEIRDQLMWIYGSGFPKSLDLSKAIDKSNGAIRDVVGYRDPKGSVHGNAIPDSTGTHKYSGQLRDSWPLTDAAIQWQGWGTALKPAHEPIVLARKPFSGTVASNVLEHGTGAINIDECRIGAGTGNPKPPYVANHKNAVFGHGAGGGAWENTNGRWPANVILDEEAGRLLDTQSGISKSVPGVRRNSYKNGNALHDGVAKDVAVLHSDVGGASRFFYCAKASSRERDGSSHPTVKPLALMRYLCRLITPPGGVVLDPYAGTGTTGEAAILEGFHPILIEREAEYLPDIYRRMGRSAQEYLPLVDVG